MPVETAVDRLSFLAAADFGCQFTYRVLAAGSVLGPYAGLFDNDYLQQDGDGEAAIATRAPRLTARTADLVNEGREGDEITITSAPSQPELAGRVYKVTVSRPDGTGMTLLWLEKIA